MPKARRGSGALAAGRPEPGSSAARARNDLTVRLDRAEDVPAAAAELVAAGLALAMLVATDEEATEDR